MSNLESRATHSVHKRHNGNGMKKELVARADKTCAGSSDLYILPAGGANIDSARQTTISWNSACLNNTAQIDIYLYAPLQPSASLPIHAWTRIPVSEGSYAVKLAPKWWNATSSVELSLNIVPTGNQPWDSSFSYGPAWYATYTAPTDGSAPPADAIVGSPDSNKLISIFYKQGQLTKGGIAAAIVVPLIVVFIALGIFIRKKHLSRNNKLADWAEHMDKRMSKISLDWTSGGNGNAGPVPGSRPASFAMPRPQSAYRPSVEAVRAAYAAGIAHYTNTEDEHGEQNEMSESHQHADSLYSARRSNYRVSFAPSTELSHARGQSSAHNHPLPKLNTSRFASNSQDESSDEFAMSPLQNAGAAPLNVDALRRSLDEQSRQSMMEYPALQMMDGQGAARSTESNEQHEESPYEDDSQYQATVPISAHTGMAPPANSESPDAALAQYAALRAAAGPSPSPMTNQGNNNQMRNLYGSQMLPTTPSIGAASSVDDNDVVGYNQMIDGPAAH